ncbi:MAG: Lrp/AsnC family transcriptional regulator [Terracidiphilus sp.]|jgi:Lrp/AsnC family leucine-responsive transcriptional regulator
MAEFVRLSRSEPLQAEQSEKVAAMDGRDMRILSELGKNGRISYQELGKMVNLSANAAAQRVRRLEAVGVIRGFSVEVSLASLGLKLQAFVDVKLRQGTTMEAFEKALGNIPGIREAASITGTFDARLQVDCADPVELGRLVEQLRVEAGVQSTSSTVICRELEVKRR